MKYRFLLISVAILFIVSSAELFAGGGKVRGENGEGAVNQIQVEDPPPFPED